MRRAVHRLPSCRSSPRRSWLYGNGLSSRHLTRRRDRELQRLAQRHQISFTRSRAVRFPQIDATGADADALCDSGDRQPAIKPYISDMTPEAKFFGQANDLRNYFNFCVPPDTVICLVREPAPAQYAAHALNASPVAVSSPHCGCSFIKSWQHTTGGFSRPEFTFFAHPNAPEFLPALDLHPLPTVRIAVTRGTMGCRRKTDCVWPRTLLSHGATSE